MIDSRTAALLQDIVRRESRSLLQYVSEAFPWVTPEERAALAELQKMINEERRAAQALGQYLVRQRVPPPYLGPYPMEYTTINYVSLDHLLPVLVENQRQAIARLERDLAAVTDAGAREQVEKILAMKQRHLTTLEAMAAAHPDRAATSPAAVATVS
ncbi:MAG TPA: hypothetical protein VNK04_22340 [Gemmataceae bacterium]|nr:hypothetical protein [Gemmataceae bacterium]